MQKRPDRFETESAAMPPPSFRRRLFWLLVCVAVGLGAGFIGYHFTDNTAWFLALPIALAVGWLFFANPAECQPKKGCGPE